MKWILQCSLCMSFCFSLDHQMDYSIEEIVDMFEHPEKDTVLQEAVEWLED